MHIILRSNFATSAPPTADATRVVKPPPGIAAEGRSPPAIPIFSEILMLSERWGSSTYSLADISSPLFIASSGTKAGRESSAPNFAGLRLRHEHPTSAALFPCTLILTARNRRQFLQAVGIYCPPASLRSPWAADPSLLIAASSSLVPRFDWRKHALSRGCAQLPINEMLSDQFPSPQRGIF